MKCLSRYCDFIGEPSTDGYCYTCRIETLKSQIQSLQTRIKDVALAHKGANEVMHLKIDEVKSLQTQLEEAKKNAKDWKNNCDDSDELIHSLQIELEESKAKNKKLLDYLETLVEMGLINRESLDLLFKVR